MNTSAPVSPVLLLLLLLVGACGGDGQSSAPRPGASPDDDPGLQARVSERVREDSTLAAPIRSYYGSPRSTLLWASNGSNRDQMRDALRQARLEGVSSDDLRVEEVRRSLESIESEDGADRVEAEVALSAALLHLAEVYARGSDLRPELEVEWDMDRDPKPTDEILSLAAREGVGSALDSVRPMLGVYHRTVQALERYQQRVESGTGWEAVQARDDRTVAPGESDPLVTAVRRRLSASTVEGERERADHLEAGAERADHLDPELAGAIALFQRRHGLEVDSVIGPETIAAMNVPLPERIDQLKVNLDRIRRLPRDFGERAVLVNVAGFELRVLERNRPVMEMAVVVGQPEWRTNVFSDSIEHLIVNPYWHVPESIEATETLPKVKAEPGYLAANRMSVVPAGDNFGEPVDPGTIDWSAVSAEEMPYDFRQEPGPENSLGQVKFMFPNRYNIYLHDTPADELFQEDFRAFSHGCIRVERPWELARYIVESSSDRTADELMAMRESGERTRLELSEPIPVFLAYLTSWVDENGDVSFHQDLYNQDERVEDALGEDP